MESEDENSMESEDENFSFGFWKKIVVVFLVLLPADAFLAWRLQIRLGDLLFFEGLVVFGAGALAASGVADLRGAGARAYIGTITGHPRGQKELLEERGRARKRNQVHDSRSHNHSRINNLQSGRTLR
jgi:hypothetical protein